MSIARRAWLATALLLLCPRGLHAQAEASPPPDLIFQPPIPPPESPPEAAAPEHRRAAPPPASGGALLDPWTHATAAKPAEDHPKKPPPFPALAGHGLQSDSLLPTEPPLKLEQPRRKSYAVAIFFSYLLPIPMVPIVHGIHGNVGYGFLGLVGVYGAMFAGAYLASLSCSQASRHSEGCLGTVLAGMAVGWLGWAAFDAAVLAYEEPPKTPAAAVPSRARNANVQFAVAVPSCGLGAVAMLRRRF